MVANQITSIETVSPEAKAFDVNGFDALSEMIGEDGAREMVAIFEAETRQRLRRLAAGDQDLASLMREMHTLKGAAGTVASPRLAAFGRALEQAAEHGRIPTPSHIRAMEEALDAFLTAARIRNETRSAVM